MFVGLFCFACCFCLSLRCSLSLSFLAFLVDSVDPTFDGFVCMLFDCAFVVAAAAACFGVATACFRLEYYICGVVFRTLYSLNVWPF